MSLSNEVFKTILNPDVRARIEELRKNHQRKVELFASLDDEALARMAEEYYKHCQRPHHEVGSPVYDVVMHDIIIPEMIKRLK